MTSKVMKTATASDVHNTAVNESGTAQLMSDAGINPVAETNADLREHGNFFLNNPDALYKYVNTLVNRIALTEINRRVFRNSLERFKKGNIELGDSIQEIYIEMAQPFAYDITKAEQEVFKREIPKVLQEIHYFNYMAMYKVTIQRDDLKRKFLNWSVYDDYLAGIIQSIYNGDAYDSFLATAYLIGKSILTGKILNYNVGSKTTTEIIKDIKTTSLEFKEPNSLYNYADVINNCDIERQYLIQSNEFSVDADVDVLANAFNLDKVEFLPMTMTLQKFSNLKWDRLAKLMANEPNFEPFTADELTKLDTLKAVLISDDWFKLYDIDRYMDEIRNPQGKYYNTFYHVSSIVSSSPFENAVAFTGFDLATPTAITLTFDKTNVDVGGVLTFDVVVTGSDNENVTYTIADNTSTATFVDKDNKILVIGGNETAAQITITASIGNVASTPVSITINA